MRRRWVRLRRGLLESLAIIASILLAFWIDAWWDGRVEDAEYRRILVGLHADFTATDGLLAAHARLTEGVIAASDSLLFLLDTPADSVEIPVETFVAALRAPTPDPPQGTLRAVLGSGRLDAIQDVPLRTALAQWPDAIADLQRKAAMSEEFVYNELLPELRHIADLTPLVQGRIEVVTDQRPDLSGASETLRVPATRGLRNIIQERRLFAYRALGPSFRRVSTLSHEILEALAPVAVPD